MKIQTVIFALLATLCFAVQARAEFTSAEKAQVLQLVTGHQEALTAMSWAGGFMRSGTTTANKSDIACVMEGSASALDHLAVSFGFLTKSPVQQSPHPDSFSRSAQLDIASNQLNQTLSGLRNAEVCADRLSPMTDVPSVLLSRAIRSLESFDFNPPYAEPRLSDYPALIGPHGSYDVATAAQFHLQRYQLRVFRRMARIYAGSPYVAPSNILDDYNVITTSSARILKNAFKAWALDVGVEPPAEKAIVDLLFENCQIRDPEGTCNRPRTFWRALVANELFTAFLGYNNTIPGDRMNTDFTGRTWLPASATTQFFTIGNHIAVLAANGDLSYSTNEDERLVLGDHMDSWKDMDVYLGAQFLFSVDAPPSPPNNDNGGSGGNGDSEPVFDPSFCGVGTQPNNNEECIALILSCPEPEPNGFVPVPTVFIDGVPVVCVESQ